MQHIDRDLGGYIGLAQKCNAHLPCSCAAGVQDSDDESPLVSSTSDDVVWPFNGRGDGLQTTTSDGVIDRIFCGAEAFEMGKLKCVKSVTFNRVSNSC